jgi:low affinity Fe/Cu permease
VERLQQERGASAELVRRGGRPIRFVFERGVHIRWFGRRLLGRMLAWHLPARCVVNESRRQQHELDSHQKLPQSGLSHWFSRFASRTADLAGSHWAFIITFAFIVVWFLSGPVFGFSDTWQLIANTVTTLTTALMVFLIQNTQNRDSRAIHLKLDELLRATPGARNAFMEAEEEDLDEIEREKEIVDQADPDPPAHKRKERERTEPEKGKMHAVPGNGKSKHS